MKLAWCTDPHLNFVGRDATAALCERIMASGARALLLGGDVAEAASVEEWLLFLAERLELPIHFVLGNHDYYGGSIVAVRRRIAALEHERLGRLGDESATAAHPERRLTVLCGHTHGAGESRPAPNLHVFTGAARYGHPAFELLEF